MKKGIIRLSRWAFLRNRDQPRVSVKKMRCGSSYLLSQYMFVPEKFSLTHELSL